MLTVDRHDDVQNRNVATTGSTSRGHVIKTVERESIYNARPQLTVDTRPIVCTYRTKPGYISRKTSISTFMTE